MNLDEDPTTDHTLRRLQEQVSEWSQRNFPNNEAIHPLAGVAEEVGELMHWWLKGQQRIRHSRTEVVAGKIDAVGDILIYLADYCERDGIDMQYAVESTWEAVSQRNWQADPINAGRETE